MKKAAVFLVLVACEPDPTLGPDASQGDMTITLAITNASSYDFVELGFEFCDDTDCITVEAFDALIEVGDTLESEQVVEGVVYGAEDLEVGVATADTDGDIYCWNDCELKVFETKQKLDVDVVLTDDDCCWGP